jgi:hypothetical protein
MRKPINVWRGGAKRKNGKEASNTENSDNG